MHREISRTSRVALEMTMGISLLLLSVLVYTRQTTVDPFLEVTFGSRCLANAAAFTHFVAILTFWSSVSRLAKGPGIAFVSGTAGLLAALAVSEVVGINFGDLLRFYVGRHAAWIVIILAVAMLPLIRASFRSYQQQFWKHWALLGGASFCGGLVIYATAVSKGTGGVFAEATLILTLPTLSLILTALRYRGRHELLLRGLAMIGAMVGAGVASIR